MYHTRGLRRPVCEQAHFRSNRRNARRSGFKRNYRTRFVPGRNNQEIRATYAFSQRGLGQEAVKCYTIVQSEFVRTQLGSAMQRIFADDVEKKVDTLRTEVMGGNQKSLL